MGIDYNALLYVGKLFDSQGEAENFIKDANFLSETDKEELEELGLSEFLATYPHLGGESIDSYSGYGFIVGYELSFYVYEPETYLAAYKESVRDWYELFKDVKPEIIHEVKVW